MKTDLILRPGRADDAGRLAELDIACFSVPWSEASFAADLTDAAKAFYLVWEYEGSLIGYGGYWRVIDQAEIMNIAIAPNWRRQGLAGTVLERLIIQAKAEGLASMTLEVREGNSAALALYHRYGFYESGLRRNYYADNNENAIIMLKNIH